MMVRQFRTELAAVCLGVCVVGISCSDGAADNSTTAQVGGAKATESDPTTDGGGPDTAATGGASATRASSARTGTGGATAKTDSPIDQATGGASTQALGGAGPATGRGGSSATGKMGRGGGNSLGKGGSQGQSVQGGSSARGGSTVRSSTAATTGGSTAAGGSAAKTGGAASTGDSSSTSTGTPTWTALYNKYLATGTVGHCGSCHSQANSASKAYAFLKSEGQIDGTSSKLVVQGSSDLIWFGGKMPEGGKASDAPPELVADFRAWVAAGALNN